MYLHALDALAQPQEKQPTDEQLLCRRDMLVQEQVFENLEQDLALDGAVMERSDAGFGQMSGSSESGPEENETAKEKPAEVNGTLNVVKVGRPCISRHRMH